MCPLLIVRRAAAVGLPGLGTAQPSQVSEAHWHAEEAEASALCLPGPRAQRAENQQEL